MGIEIIDIYEYEGINKNLGYRIALKNIEINSFKDIIKIFRKLGLKRDVKEERRLKKFSNDIIYNKNPPKINPKYADIEHNYKKLHTEASYIYNKNSIL